MSLSVSDPPLDTGTNYKSTSDNEIDHMAQRGGGGDCWQGEEEDERRR